MQPFKTALMAIPLALASLGCSAHNQNSSAHSHTAGDNSVHLMGCAIQETIPGAKATGAFLTVHKHGNEALSVVAAKVPDASDHVEIHEMVMKDGTMKMSQIHDYPLKSGDNVFKKGGYHVMLMALKKTLTVGETYPLTLVFSDGSEKTCDANVKSVAELTPKSMKMHHHHNHGEMQHNHSEMTHNHGEHKHN